MYYNEEENSLRVYRVVKYKSGEMFLVGLYLRKQDAKNDAIDRQVKDGSAYYCVEEETLEFYYKGE